MKNHTCTSCGVQVVKGPFRLICDYLTPTGISFKANCEICDTVGLFNMTLKEGEAFLQNIFDRAEKKLQALDEEISRLRAQKDAKEDWDN